MKNFQHPRPKNPTPVPQNLYKAPSVKRALERVIVMKFVRWFLGRVILAVNFLTGPKAVERTPEEQAAMDALTANMSLYQFNACPFCVKVRRVFKRYALNIELRDAQNDPDIKAELLREGGSPKVPCLRIERAPGDVTWLYESNDIIAFLKTELKLV